MASEAVIKKMIQTIMDKRKELGILDWGRASKQEVANALKPGNSSKTNSDTQNNLAKVRGTHHNKKK